MFAVHSLLFGALFVATYSDAHSPKGGDESLLPPPPPINYTVRDDSIFRTDGPHFNNRPLYGPHNGLIVLAGDRPLVKFGATPFVSSQLLFGVKATAATPDADTVWFHDIDINTTTSGGARRITYTSAYTASKMEWNVMLPSGTNVSCTVAPLVDGLGIAVKLQTSLGATPAAAKEELVFATGGAYRIPSGRPLGWYFDGAVNLGNLLLGFDPSTSKGNQVKACANGTWTVLAEAGAPVVVGTTSVPSNLSVVNVTALFPKPAVGAAVHKHHLDVHTEQRRRDAMSQHGGTNCADHSSSRSSSSDGSNSTDDNDGDAVCRQPRSIDVVASSLTELALPPITKGLVGWYHAASLPSTSGKVASWPNSAPSSTPPPSRSSSAAVQLDPASQPTYVARGIGGQPSISFDGVKTWLSAGNLNVPAFKTVFAVVRVGNKGGNCCNGIATLWNASRGIDMGESTNGIAVKQSGAGIVTILDWPGENDEGIVPVQNDAAVLAATFADASAVLYTNGCLDVTSLGAHGAASTNISFGLRASDMEHTAGRYFEGTVGEVLVYDRPFNSTELQAMSEHLANMWNVQAPACKPPNNKMVMLRGSYSLAAHQTVYLAAGDGVSNPSTISNPATSFAAAEARGAALGSRVQAETPDQHFNVGVSVAGAAVDGLYRGTPPVFLHGAMAWDVALVGWRSQYGGTVLGWEEEVAAEGRYFFKNQVQESSSNKNAVCKSDPALLLTQEAKDSRFYGKGRVKGGDGMYDMQSQMFDQQIHMWRWTGNETHEALLRPALELHAGWTSDCFDSDGDGLYHAYINTWPTDSVWFNGGSAPEESGYMHRLHAALADMASRANDTTAAKAHHAKATQIHAAFTSDLWLRRRGHPAAFKEEIGHRRLRPDAWLYSIQIPIEAGLLTMEQAAQALHYTEWGLQRDPFICEDGTECGVRVWTSNWVPSIWSVREFWPGDNYALAMAYQKAGLPDGGYQILSGNMHHDQYNFVTPGVLGASNGGIDFNDIVHPFARTIVEGVFGFNPDYPNGKVLFAPQFPSAWSNATVSTPHFGMTYNDTYNANAKTSKMKTKKTVSVTVATLTFTVNVSKPATLLLRLPVRGRSVTAMTLNGIATSTSAASVTFEAGFGQTTVTVETQPNQTAATLMIEYDGPVDYTPSIAAVAVVGQELKVDAPQGWKFINISDPQGIFESVEAFQPGNASTAGGTVAGGVDAAGEHMFFGYVIADGGSGSGSGGGSGGGVVGANSNAASTFPALQRAIMYKVSVTDPVAEAYVTSRTKPKPVSDSDGNSGGGSEQQSVQQGGSASTYDTVDITKYLNADVSNIYHPEGGYVSPRPKTCSARIGTDGYSAWTFTYGQGNTPPHPDFSNVTANLGRDGRLVTPQGAVFDASHLRQSKPPPSPGNNIAFTSMWDNYPTKVTVPVSNVTAGDSILLLVAGSTNPMQTLLPNAEIRFNFSDGSSEVLELVPPRNYWCLSTYGGKYYDYARDWHALPPTPPASVQLGKDLNAMVYRWNVVPKSATLVSVTLETLSLEVVVGLLGLTVEHQP